MRKEETVTGIVTKSSVETALEAEKSDKRKKNGLYRSYTPTKAAAVSNIVEGGFNELVSAGAAPKCVKGDLNTIKQRTAEYIQRRMVEQRLPTIEGLAVSLGIGRQTLYDWLADSRDRDCYDFLNLVRDTFSDMHASSAMEGLTNPISWIFYSKNHFGYSDKTEVVLSPGVNPLGEQASAEELQQKYLEAVGDDEE